MVNGFILHRGAYFTQPTAYLHLPNGDQKIGAVVREKVRNIAGIVEAYRRGEVPEIANFLVYESNGSLDTAVAGMIDIGKGRTLRFSRSEVMVIQKPHVPVKTRPGPSDINREVYAAIEILRSFRNAAYLNALGQENTSQTVGRLTEDVAAVIGDGSKIGASRLTELLKILD